MCYKMLMRYAFELSGNFLWMTGTSDLDNGGKMLLYKDGEEQSCSARFTGALSDSTTESRAESASGSDDTTGDSATSTGTVGGNNNDDSGGDGSSGGTGSDSSEETGGGSGSGDDSGSDGGTGGDESSDDGGTGGDGNTTTSGGIVLSFYSGEKVNNFLLNITNDSGIVTSYFGTYKGSYSENGTINLTFLDGKSHSKGTLTVSGNAITGTVKNIKLNLTKAS